jgi:hypothetical protein
MRGFGGIFPLVPEGDVEGIQRSSELFETASAGPPPRPGWRGMRWRRKCACAFAHHVLGPRYSGSWRMLMYLNRVLRSRIGEDSLDTLRASREVLAREGVMWVAGQE